MGSNCIFLEPLNYQLPDAEIKKNCFSLGFSPTTVLYLIEILLQVNKA